MAVALTYNSSPDEYTSTSGGTGENSIGSITIPSDADMCIVIASGYPGSSGDLDFDELNWDGDNSDVDFDLIVMCGLQITPPPHDTMFAYRMDTEDAGWPGTGSGKTLWFSYNLSPSENGPNLLCFFLSGTAQSTAIIGTDTQDQFDDGSWTCSDLGDVTANDAGIIAGTTYNQTGDVEVSGQTKVLESAVNNGFSLSVGFEAGEDVLTVNDGGNGYLIGLAFAIEAAAVGGAKAPTSIIHGPLVGPLGGPI